jgi:hypothetical protein
LKILIFSRITSAFIAQYQTNFTQSHSGKLYDLLESLQVDLDKWISEYNEQRTHTGKYCYERTPWETFKVTKEIALAKMVDQSYQ